MSNVRIVSTDELERRLAVLEADREMWWSLIEKYGDLDWGLQQAIDETRWLLGLPDDPRGRHAGL